MARGLWACGAIGRAHGLKGEVYLELLRDGLDYLQFADEVFLSVEGGDRLQPARVTRAGGTDRRPLLRLDGVDTREAAIALHGATLFACGERLDQGEFYRVGELIGLPAVSGGQRLGVVDDLLVGPVHELLQLRLPDGSLELIPFVPELVEVDLEAGELHVREGLL